MATSATTTSHRDDIGKLLLRLAVGILLMLHGIAKLTSGIGWMAGPLGAIGLPAFVGYGVYVGEIVAPLFLVAGKFTRLAGLVVAFNMLMAIIVARRDAIFALSDQGGAWEIELEMLFLVGGLVFWFFGSGRYALSKGTGRWD